MKRLPWPGVRRREAFSSSAATRSSHTCAGSLPRAAGFAEKNRPLFCAGMGPKLYPYSFPLGLPGEISTDRRPFATGPRCSRRGQ